MAVFKVKKDDTYETIARRSGVSAGAVMRYFKGRPIYKGMTFNTATLAGMVQGGQAYAALSPDINPWGMPEGEIPDWAWETEEETFIAENYLAAIGMSQYGFGVGEAGPGITTEEGVTETIAGDAGSAAERHARSIARRRARDRGATGVTTETRPPAEEAPQAQMIGPEQLTAGVDTTTAYETSRGRRVRKPTEAARVEGVSAGAFPEVEQDLGMFGLSPVWEGLKAGLGSGFEMIGEAFGIGPGEGQETTSGRSWEELYFGGGATAETQPPSTAAGRGPRQPSHYGSRGTGMAALEVLQAIDRGGAPLTIAPDVAVYLGYSDELMDKAGYKKNPETGKWELDETSRVPDIGEGEVAGGGVVYSGTYGGYGRGRPRGGGWRGGRRQPYSSTLYNGQVNTQFNWRIGWN